ncbi:hypothetical protein HNQ08_004947 [Deinococcus humi]|uniref:Uncharacterized protein n=1 Tax=Deinococcus humi TaxID=662880 RepID=A0A7W8NGS4_9DEIO|nr:hypothetical protein [Deinococcus humi]
MLRPHLRFCMVENPHLFRFLSIDAYANASKPWAFRRNAACFQPSFR